MTTKNNPNPGSEEAKEQSCNEDCPAHTSVTRTDGQMLIKPCQDDK